VVVSRLKANTLGLSMTYFPVTIAYSALGAEGLFTKSTTTLSNAFPVVVVE
jgi:hypothetical protein